MGTQRGTAERAETIAAQTALCTVPPAIPGEPLSTSLRVPLPPTALRCCTGNFQVVVQMQNAATI